MTKDLIDKFIIIEEQDAYYYPVVNVVGPKVYCIYVGGVFYTRTPDRAWAEVRMAYMKEKFLRWFNESVQ